MIIYSRAFRVNDYVSLGDTEGLVTDLGLLSTKLLTVQKEEIVIPNATLVGMKAVNYTRLANDQGSVASTSVTIGYDAPWRQVHSMLLLAASRAAGVCRQPPPRVIQRSLGDFYIEYCLMVQLLPLARPEERPIVLSELHGHIQDIFNEHGVQIMSPHFMVQPPNPWSSPSQTGSPLQLRLLRAKKRLELQSIPEESDKPQALSGGALQRKIRASRRELFFLRSSEAPKVSLAARRVAPRNEKILSKRRV